VLYLLFRKTLLLVRLIKHMVRVKLPIVVYSHHCTETVGFLQFGYLGIAVIGQDAIVDEHITALFEVLNQQIAALRRQLGALEQALDVSEKKDKDAQSRLADLGQRLNVALAQRVQELSRYRSEFFGRLRAILGNRPDIRIVGDRFVFQSEVLFTPGSAELAEAAKIRLDPVIAALKEISGKIPPDISWVLRIDGHTDRRPINNEKFASNWELSAARAISVVRYAIAQGIPPERLTAAGFADNQPLDPGDTDEAYRRNRRIELKLTER